MIEAFLPQASTYAADIDNLFSLIFWLVGVWFVACEGVFFYLIFKFLSCVCAACHGQDGKGNEAMNSPPLVGGSDWYYVTQLKNFKAGIRGSNPADTTGVQMRGMSMMLSDDDAIKDVVAHIMTLN